jgi:hypothetical protein
MRIIALVIVSSLLLSSCKEASEEAESKVLLFQNGKEYPDWVFDLLAGDSCLIKCKMVSNEKKDDEHIILTVDVPGNNSSKIHYKLFEVAIADIIYRPPLFYVKNSLVSNSYQSEFPLKCICRMNQLGHSIVDSRKDEWIYLLVSPVSWSSEMAEINSIVHKDELETAYTLLSQLPRFLETNSGIYLLAK